MYGCNKNLDDKYISYQQHIEHQAFMDKIQFFLCLISTYNKQSELRYLFLMCQINNQQGAHKLHHSPEQQKP